MLFRRNGILLIGMLFFFAGCGNDSTSPEVEDPQIDESLSLPSGFRAVVVAEDLGQARHITVSENGDIYIILKKPDSNGNGIVALRDNNGDGQADETEYFGDISGTGIQLYEGYLYASSGTEIIRYSMDGGNLVPSSGPETIVEGFPEQDTHTSKPFTFDRDGNIYVTVGAPSNACQQESRESGSPGEDPCPQLERQAGIWRFDAATQGQRQQGDGYHYAKGIRNAVAIDWNSNAGALYVVQHGRDQLHKLWPEHYSEDENAELPAEEFLLVEDGSVFGWPYTYYDHHQEARVIAPEYGGDGEAVADEGEYPDPIMTFPAHWAPNDLLFYQANHFPEQYRNGAFIAFHGSWNRSPQPQQGYNVVFVPFDGNRPSGDYEVFADGFKGSTQIDSPDDAQHRPMGLATGPDGSLYISDSVEGKVWRIVYDGD